METMVKEYIAGAHGGDGKQRHLNLKDVVKSKLWGKELLVEPINKKHATVGQFTVVRLVELDHIHEGLAHDFCAIYLLDNKFISTEEKYDVLKERIETLLAS